MTDLHEILELATDRVEPSGGATAALATARRRRRTRRGVVASAAVVVLVAGVAVVGRLGGDTPSEPVPAPSPPPPTRTVEPEPLSFDPQLVDDLPPAPAGLVRALPDALDVPTSSTPSLADDPVAAAVLTVGRPDALKVLGVDGRWRHVYPPVEGGAVQLSDDGTRLAVEAADGVDLWDVATGEHSTLPGSWDEAELPPGIREAHEAVLRGSGVEIRWSDADDSLAVVVGDHRLLVRDDDQATYANGALSVQAVLDDGTVLLRILVDPGPAASVRFVAWEPDSGELWWVMHVPDVLPGWSVAAGLLG